MIFIKGNAAPAPAEPNAATNIRNLSSHVEYDMIRQKYPVGLPFGFSEKSFCAAVELPIMVHARQESMKGCRANKNIEEAHRNLRKVIEQFMFWEVYDEPSVRGHLVRTRSPCLGDRL
jgi:hypothetical protein